MGVGSLRWDDCAFCPSERYAIRRFISAPVKAAPALKLARTTRTYGSVPSPVRGRAFAAGASDVLDIAAESPAGVDEAEGFWDFVYSVGFVGFAGFVGFVGCSGSAGTGYTLVNTAPTASPWAPRSTAVVVPSTVFAMDRFA